MESNNGTDEITSQCKNNSDERFEDTVDGNCLGDSNTNGYGNLDDGDALGRGGEASGEVNARMPVEKYATHYNMNHKRRGVAYIFNHEVFDVDDLKQRSGTNEDCENLKACLASFEFDIQVFKDLKYDEIEFHVRQAAEMDHSEHDCILITVLSHGEMGIIYARDMAYKPEYLWTQFTADKCPTLAGKPKIFFLQARQGNKLDSGVSLHKNYTETDGEPSNLNTYKIPSQADFLIVYATIKGYYSWRNPTKGSWFVQSLCEELKKRWQKHDLVTILTFVSLRVAVDFESNVPDSVTMHRQKQIPCILSMLTRLIRFSQTEQSNY